MSIEDSDREAEAVAVAPRVTLDHLKSQIRTVNYFTVGEALEALGQPTPERCDVLTICIVTVTNGFTFVGMSAPSSSDNFNGPLGRKLAYEDCIRQMWPMEGYLLRSTIAGIV